jgi:flagellar basal body P-ring formation protein FlgA
MRASCLPLTVGLLVLCVGASGAEVSVELRPKATLGRVAEIAIGDIASVESADAALKAGIERLKVGTAPRSQNAGYVLRSQVERQIRLSFPGTVGHIHWRGSERVHVRFAGTQIAGAEIEARARAYLENSLRERYANVRVEPVATGPLTVPLGVVELQPRACGRPAAARRMCVWMDVRLDGAPFKSVPVWFRVQAYRSVLVAKSPRPAGTAFYSNDFTTELREVSALSSAPLAPGEEGRAARLKRTLAFGEVLLRGDIEPMPAVARNQEVTVKIRAGMIRVEAPGLALSDGRLGSVIRVQNPLSREIYRARIVDEGVVMVNIR